MLINLDHLPQQSGKITRKDLVFETTILFIDMSSTYIHIYYVKIYNLIYANICISYVDFH